MKRILLSNITFLMVCLCFVKNYGQGFVPPVEVKQDLYFSSNGGTQIIQNIGDTSYSNLPDWISISYSGSTATLTCEPASIPRAHQYVVGYPPGGGNFYTGCIAQGDSTLDCTTEEEPTTPTTPNTTCKIESSTSFMNLMADGETRYVDLTFTDCSSTSIVSYSYKDYGQTTGTEIPKPYWIDVSQKFGEDRLTVEIDPNTTGEKRGLIISGLNTDGSSFGFILEQSDEFCTQNWYSDVDGDGFGDNIYRTIISCVVPDDYGITWVKYNDLIDQCPYEVGTFELNGCPYEEPENKTWIKSTTYDRLGEEKASAKAYYNEMGNSSQTQTVNFKTNSVWASEVKYDYEGMPALQTMTAPIREGNTFEYKDDFIKKADGSDYTKEDFDVANESDIAAVGEQVNTLGHYYSEAVSGDQGQEFQDITDYPFTKTIYSDLRPGEVLKSVGGNKINGEWLSGYSYTMKASNELTTGVAFNNNDFGSNVKIVKTVVRDVHGVDSVVFKDTDGNLLASARSGGSVARTHTLNFEAHPYADVHVPVGVTGFSISNSSGQNIIVYNLITEQIETIATSMLTNGFYRVTVENSDSYIPNSVSVTYKENYYDYALNYYDRAGRLLKSTQPVKDANGNNLETIFEYNSLGQLYYTKSPDEGEAWFRYRADGQIRFSQNEKQVLDGEFSYTNYDSKARPVESGVAKGTFNGINPDNESFTATEKKEQHFTLYDVADSDALEEEFDYWEDDRKADYQHQTFVAGNISKTYTENPATTITWYSYDIYGRVTWIVQQIEGLDGLKTIDYEYDGVTGSVNKVYYQKGVNTEQFIHKYSYDPIDNSLVKVETSTDDSTFIVHADYEYYESGALKRTELAQGLQGIDYVYNLNGTLKAINHPSLDPTKDPGGDANDLFGMHLDYYQGDYNRSGVHINTSNFGEDQYNGNIKAVRWNNSATDAHTEHEKAYVYSYDRNNWLTQADYITGDGSGIVTPVDLSFNNKTLSVAYTATNSITVTPETTIAPGAELFIGEIESGADDYQVSNITYDANGNIQSLKRNKSTRDGSNAMDNMTYHYDPSKPNQLKRVEDAVTAATDADDIKTQSANNYEYNEIGQLEYNNEEGIEYIYTASGLVSEIKKDNTTLLKFFYDDRGKRVKKESYNPTNGSLLYTDVYVRDAAGTPMAIYRDEQVVEHTVYGASRLGVFKREDASTAYELTDHLGNVRAVIEKETESYTGTDYYPFGMAMPLRNSLSDYRYAYQGQEKDSETGKEAFQLRLWDARIGRWLTTDPYGQYSSPYLGMGNDPINGIDPDGGFRTKAARTWAWVKSGFYGKLSNFGTCEDCRNKDNKYFIGLEGGYIANSKEDISAHKSGFDGYVNSTDGLSAKFFGSYREANNLSKFQFWRNESSQGLLGKNGVISHTAVELTYGTAENVYSLFTGHTFTGSLLERENRADAGLDGFITVVTAGFGYAAKSGLKILKSSAKLYNSFSKSTKGYFKGANHATLRSEAYKAMILKHNRLSTGAKKGINFFGKTEDLGDVIGANQD